MGFVNRHHRRRCLWDNSKLTSFHLHTVVVGGRLTDCLPPSLKRRQLCNKILLNDWIQFVDRVMHLNSQPGRSDLIGK